MLFFKAIFKDVLGKMASFTTMSALEKSFKNYIAHLPLDLMDLKVPILADWQIKAIQEVQIRFLMAAAAAGAIELRMEEPDLREAMRNQQDELRTSIKANALAASAYTYQAFSDDEVAAYAEALENPKMQKVYALMNAVQYEIMANRFEAVAARLADMQPSQDL